MPIRRQQGVAFLLVLAAVLLVSCGASPISYPTGGRDIVVRLSGTGGGMLPGRLYYFAGQFPPFTLFGDGTLVYTTDSGFYQAHLDDAAIRQVLDRAVNDARFFDLPDFVGPTCCDMPSSQITITANGQTKSVSMSILEETANGDSPEQRLQRVLEVINALRTSKDAIYTPTGATLHVEVAPRPPADTPPIWPLAQIALADALKESDGLHLTGADAQAALQTAPGVEPFVENEISYLVIAVPDPP
jgi:hypothetical protein